MDRSRTLVRCLAVLAAVAVNALAHPSGPAMAAPGRSQAVTAAPAIHRAWQGRVHLAVSLDKPTARSAHRVIRDQVAYEAFVATIPSHQISKTQPAPPSDDPLLKKPVVDWATKMLLVAIRDDSMYVGPRITGITRKDSEQTVTVVFPPLGDSAWAAAQLGIGTYHAVLVDRFGGTVRFSTAR